jgi:hypothetical protein
MSLDSHHNGYLHVLGTNLGLLEISVWMQSFALAMITVFFPIVLWQLGLSIQAIILFYVVFNALDVPLNLVARKAVLAYGARRVMIVAVFFHVIYYLAFLTLRNNIGQIFLLALAFAAADAFYWVTHLYIFAAASHKGASVRDDVSMLRIVRTVGALIAPLLGVFLFIDFGSRELIAISGGVMILSLLPLALMKRFNDKPKQKPESFRDFFKTKSRKIHYGLEMVDAIRMEQEAMLWPFFLFFLYGSLESVALVPVLASLASLVLVYAAGRISKGKNIFRLMGYGSIFIFLILFARIGLYDIPLVALGSVFVLALVSILFEIPLEVGVFKHDAKTDLLSVATYRNGVRMFARGLFYLLMFLAVVIFSVEFFFISFIFIMLLMLFVSGFLVRMDIAKK